MASNETPLEIAARKAFIAMWRTQTAVASGTPLHQMDVRKCHSAVRDDVQAATEAHIEKLAKEYRETPVQASPRLLETLGLGDLV